MADVTNIKKVRFSSGSTEGYGEDLYAHDYGQILQFEGIDLPTAYEVHFGRCAFGEGVMQIGEAGQVRVPASFLEEPGVVFLWIHVHFTEDDGTTIYMARLNVLPKADATEEVTPEEESAFAQAIAALNHAVEKTGQDAEATTAAKDAALEAQRLAEEAKSAAETTQGKSEDAQAAAETSKRLAEEAKAAAETAASGASGSEEAAKEAQRLAETAKTASETAKTSAETAKTAAETAKRLAEEAKTAAETAKETAVGAAANAADAAGTAVNKAREADESARAAYNSADAAARSAQSASEAATAAAESVRTARDYANTARNWTNGKNLDGTDSTSHIGNNANYHAEQAKKWADGEDASGDPVESTEPQYQDSAKYWAGQAADTAGMLGDVALDSTAQKFVQLVDDNSILTEEMFDLMIEMLPGDDSGQLILQDLVDENSNLDLLVRELLEREATA